MAMDLTPVLARMFSLFVSTSLSTICCFWRASMSLELYPDIPECSPVMAKYRPLAASKYIPGRRGGSFARERPTLMASEREISFKRRQGILTIVAVVSIPSTSPSAPSIVLRIGLSGPERVPYIWLVWCLGPGGRLAVVISMVPPPVSVFPVCTRTGIVSLSALHLVAYVLE